MWVQFQGQTNTQGFLIGQCKTQTADCRPGVRCRLCVKCRLQTKSKTQAGVKFRPTINCSRGRVYASVNSTCAQPPPGGADPQALAFFLPWMANSWGWGLLSCQIPRGGDEKRGQMPLPPSTLQHFSLIARSNSAILSILMCDFLFQQGF